MSAVKVIAIGNSIGVILPEETLNRLNVKTGDTLYITEIPNGLQLSPFDEEFVAKMEVAHHVVRRYRDAFKKLAE
jgi:putative addiction module antidote